MQLSAINTTAVHLRTSGAFMFPRRLLSLQSYWSLSCDHRLDFGDGLTTAVLTTV